MHFLYLSVVLFSLISASALGTGLNSIDYDDYFNDMQVRKIAVF